jgi:hypothetical protein
MIPPVDIAHIRDQLEHLEEDLVAAHEDQGAGEDTDPRPLLVAMRALLEDLAARGPGGEDQRTATRYGSGRDLTAVGDRGLDLIASLAALAGRLRRPHLAREIESLALPLACWIARCGGEINRLSPVVNSAAGLANSLKQPADLARLYGLLRELGLAASPLLSQETGSMDQTRPWRVYLLNRAIVATRSHQPALMEEAFELIADQLPEDAPDFFREGMEQMDALDYPAQVRATMQRYYDQWCRRRTLH